MNDRTYEDWLALSLKHYQGGPHPVDLQAYKRRGLLMAERLGIPHARVLASFRYLYDVDFDTLPERFAIHLGRGCSNGAVWLLERTPAGTFYEVFHKVTYTRAGLINVVEKENEKPPPVPPYLPGGWIEELLYPLPDNVKVWMFGQVPGLIARWTGTAPRRIRFWNGAWEDLGDCRIEGPHKTTFPLDSTLPVPKDAAGVLRMAREVQAEIYHPFIRVDFYDTPNGIYWGEVTPHPGGGIGKFNVETDRRLGQLWTEASGIPARQKEA